MCTWKPLGYHLGLKDSAIKDCEEIPFVNNFTDLDRFPVLLLVAAACPGEHCARSGLCSPTYFCFRLGLGLYWIHVGHGVGFHATVREDRSLAGQGCTVQEQGIVSVRGIVGFSYLKNAFDPGCHLAFNTTTQVRNGIRALRSAGPTVCLHLLPMKITSSRKERLLQKPTWTSECPLHLN